MDCDPRVLIVAVEGLAVSPEAEPEAEAIAALRLRFADGGVSHLGLTAAALEQLCIALIDNSPRSPATPGRN